jgi:rSAM/selenodomain-associated transferase 1
MNNPLQAHDPGHHNTLLLFTRWPRAGGVKTRLIPALGAQGAANAQRELTLAALRLADALERRGQCRTEVHFEGGDVHLMRAAYGCVRHYVPQEPADDLGGRMGAAFQRAFAAGSRRVVAIGSDCPGLSVEAIERAFCRLHQVPVVLGPAHDGGYYLLGLHKHLPSLFIGIDWGGAAVYGQTVARAEAAGARVEALGALHDVDRPEDWERWQQQLNVDRRQ